MQSDGNKPDRRLRSDADSMPILFACIRLIYKIPGYITKVRAFYEPIVEARRTFLLTWITQIS